MSSSDLRPIVAAVASSGKHVRPRYPESEPSGPPRVFVTVSRQAGAGGPSFGQALAHRLTALDPGDRPWESFDRELVERVANEHRVPQRLVDELEDASRNWLTDLVEGIQFSSREPGELALYHRVAQTIVTLAQAGRVVIVGRGAGFVTRNLQGAHGVHVFLIAPLEDRIKQYAQRQNVSREQAARAVREIEVNRAAFYKRHWPNMPVAPESFTITLNVAAAPVEDLVEAVVPLVMRHAGVRR